ncbi:MAG: hypothetical protein JSW41_05475 [Candidatus Aenigmatarchaeota archaeon]|nr:MAG: hypothetical protein JSW41_05475 [Candidatus Aenigmarchaeota archaeon]
MGQIGFISLVLLFGIGFAMYFGTLDACAGTDNCLGVGFIEFTNFLSSDINTMINLIIAAVVSPTGLAIIGLLTAALVLQGQTGAFIVRVVLIIGLNILFVPFTFVGELGAVPFMIQLFIRTAFNLFMIIAVMSYTTGRDF